MKQSGLILLGTTLTLAAMLPACGGSNNPGGNGGGGAGGHGGSSSTSSGGGGASSSSSSSSTSASSTSSSTSASSTSSSTSASSTSSSTSASSTSASSTSSSTSSGAPGGGKWVSGYYVGYQQAAYPPEAIDWNGLTHLMIGAAVPNANGTLDTSLAIDPTNGPLLGKKLVTLAHQHGKKALLMLGGAGAHDAFASAASVAHRAAFVQNLAQLATGWGLDGFDLDWEPLDPADEPDFQGLAEALRNAIPGVLLTVPVGWTTVNFPQVDAFYGQIAPLFDQINIMSYSMAGPWGGWKSWHSGALLGATSTTPSSVDTSVKSYLAAGVPAAKLGIGIAFYGTCWTAPVNAPGQNLGNSYIAADDNVMTFDHIMTAYYAAANHHWDATAHVPYLGFASGHGPEGCTFVTYEDTQSIADKGQYVHDQGLGGAIVWTINEGYRPSQPPGQQDPLMEALAQGFLQ